MENKTKKLKVAILIPHTTASSTTLRGWYHNLTMFKKAKKEQGIELYSVLNEWSRGSNMTELKELDIKWDCSIEDIKNCDVMWFDTIATDLNRVEGRMSRIEAPLKYWLGSGKPMYVFDCDGVLADTPIVPSKSMISVFRNLLRDNFDKFTLVSPHLDWDKLYTGANVIKKFYEADVTAFADIKPKSEREYLIRYVGNNFKRKRILEIMNSTESKLPVSVIGGGWNKFIEQNPKINFEGRMSLNLSDLKRIHMNSLVGLMTYPVGMNSHSILPFRIKEYLEAGIYILFDDSKETALFFEGCEKALTGSGWMRDEWTLKSARQIEAIESWTDADYAYEVSRQRHFLQSYINQTEHVLGYEYIVLNHPMI